MATSQSSALPSAANFLTLSKIFKAEKTRCTPRHMDVLRQVLNMFDLPSKEMPELIEPLAKVGYRGYIIPVLPRRVSTEMILERAESERVFRIEAAHIDKFWHRLLLQEEGPESLGVELVLTAPRSSLDSILHTQKLTVWELGIIQGEFRKKYPSAKLDTLGLRSFLTLLLIKRIKETRHRSSPFLLNRGRLLIPSAGKWLGDHSRGTEKSVKGIVYSSDGRLVLSTHPARNWPEDAGFGLTARIEKQ